MNAADTTNRPFHDWADALRGFAAIVVAISHVRDLLWIDYAGQKAFAPVYLLTAFGHSGVIIFFVLSGFWISGSCWRRLDRPGFWPDYLIDRLSRLLIVLVPALVVGGLCDWIGAGLLRLPIYGGMAEVQSLPPGTLDRLSPLALGTNLLFLQTLAGPVWGSNGPLWSLAYEFWYYLWFPALLLLVARRRVSVWLAALGIALFSGALVQGFGVWLVGAGVFALSLRPRGGWLASRLTLGAAVLLFGLLFTATGAIKAGWTDPVLGLAFGLMLLAIERGDPAMPRLLAPLATFGRTASFSLYAVHFPVAALVCGLLTQGGLWQPGMAGLVGLLAVAGGLIALALVFARGTEHYTAALRQVARMWLKKQGLNGAKGGSSHV